MPLDAESAPLVQGGAGRAAAASQATRAVSEVRALLLTDVVDSTKLSQQLGDAAMAQAWTAHDRAARDLLPEWRGIEIDKTDGMLTLFEDVADAVQYALAYHRVLAGLAVPLQARAGLHVGPVVLRRNSAEDIARGAKPIEVEGLAKPTAARVMSLACAGQTLLTAQAREALGKTPLQVESHGHWLVKGVAEPIEIFEVAPAGTRCIAPPDSEKVQRVVRAADWWMPVRDIPHNLPFQSTSFVGRGQELADIKRLLGSARLLTLLGMGGLGKTRLSLQVAAETMHQYIDGVWFVDLAPLRDPSFVLNEVAQVLGLHEQADQPLLQVVCGHLRTRHSLLILDNCEHLMAAVATLAAAILRAAPHVRLLATSREPLHVAGEQGYPILPLALPGRDDTAAELARSPAVRLFVERARQHRPGFDIGDGDASAVAQLVARLEGIPLALELAAARVRSLSVAEINVRLRYRYRLLTGGARTLEARQQTLRALVDWSYSLLNAEEQVLLDRLGVFVGGFDLTAAEQVCGDEPLAPEAVLDVLTSLIDKSLVMFEEHRGASRYRMLETIRDYANERLEAAGDQSRLAARHCEYFFALSKDAKKGIDSADHQVWIDRLETEIDNIRAAHALALAGAVDPFIAVKICTQMLGFWLLRGHATEGRAAVRASLEVPAVQSSEMAQAWALYVGATLAGAQGDNDDALQMFRTCLALRRSLGNPREIAATLSTLSLTRLQVGDAHGARSDESEALGLFRELDDRNGEAIGLLHLAQIDVYESEFAAARERLTKVRSIAQSIDDDELAGECELTLGQVDLHESDLSAAQAQFDRAHALCTRAGDRRGEAQARWWLAKLELRRGRTDTALSQLNDVAKVFRALRMQAELLGVLEDRSVAWAQNGRTGFAVRIAAAASASRQRLRAGRSPRDERSWQKHVAALAAALSAAEFDAAWAAGAQWSIDEANDMASDAEPARPAGAHAVAPTPRPAPVAPP